MKVKSVLLPTLALLLVCLVVTGTLSITNYYTKDAIAAQQQKAVQESMELLIPGGAFEAADEEGTVYKAVVSGETKWVFLTQAMGYKSKIQVMTAVNSDGSVLGVRIVNCADESPGIGQKVGTDTAFLAQFAGQAGEIGQLDAITGATYSSVGVQNAVNAALQMFQQLTNHTVTATDTATGGAVQ